MKRIAYWTLFGVTFGIYGTMLGWSLPTVSAAAGGLMPFDMRPGGYSLADAHTFLGALSAAGAEFYRNVQQRLDIVYPALMGLTLFFALAALLPARLGRWRWLLAAPALATAIFDYAENHAVAAMLSAGADGLTADLVAEASRWTILKSGTTAAVMSALLVLLLWHGCRLALLLWRARGRALVARHPVASFLVLALAITWSVQYAAFAAGMPMFALSALGTAFGLALPAVMVTAVTGGRAGVRTLLLRLVPRRRTIVWITVASAALPAAAIVIALATQGRGSRQCARADVARDRH